MAGTDGSFAHEPEPVAANLQTVPVQGRTLAVCAILSGKDVAGIAQALADVVDGTIKLAAGKKKIVLLKPV